MRTQYTVVEIVPGSLPVTHSFRFLCNAEECLNLLAVSKYKAKLVSESKDKLVSESKAKLVSESKDKLVPETKEPGIYCFITTEAIVEKQEPPVEVYSIAVSVTDRPVSRKTWNIVEVKNEVVPGYFTNGSRLTRQEVAKLYLTVPLVSHPSWISYKKERLAMYEGLGYKDIMTETSSFEDEWVKIGLMKLAAQNDVEGVVYFISGDYSKDVVQWDYVIISGLFQEAVKSGSVQVVQELLLFRSFIVHDMKQAVLCACRLGHLEVLRLLWNAKYVREDIEVEEPLLLASANGHLETVRYLIETCEKPNPGAGNSIGFRLAASNGHVEVCRYLSGIEGVNVDASDFGASMEASRSANLPIFNFLNDIKRDDYFRQKFIDTCLFSAVVGNQMEIVKRVLPETKAKSVCLAIEISGKLDMITVLIERLKQLGELNPVSLLDILISALNYSVVTPTSECWSLNEIRFVMELIPTVVPDFGLLWQSRPELLTGLDSLPRLCLKRRPYQMDFIRYMFEFLISHDAKIDYEHLLMDSVRVLDPEFPIIDIVNLFIHRPEITDEMRYSVFRIACLYGDLNLVVHLRSVCGLDPGIKDCVSFARSVLLKPSQETIARYLIDQDCIDLVYEEFKIVKEMKKLTLKKDCPVETKRLYHFIISLPSLPPGILSQAFSIFTSSDDSDTDDSLDSFESSDSDENSSSSDDDEE